jgi:uncharacterized protein YuzE
MILTIEELTARLESKAGPVETRPSEALWITLAPEEGRHAQSVEYRTPDDNTLVRVYLDQAGAIVGIEIFP